MGRIFFTLLCALELQLALAQAPERAPLLEPVALAEL